MYESFQWFTETIDYESYIDSALDKCGIWIK